MTKNESLIQALRHCASGAKFPKDCDGCPLFCADGKTCVECINNVLIQAADALEKAEERRSGRWENGGYVCGETDGKED